MEQHFFSDQDQWREARRGLFTASEIHRLLAPGKRKMTDEELAARPKSGAGSKVTFIEDDELLSDGAITYIYEKAAEILSELQPDFYNYDMQWGKDHEGEAVYEFAARMGLDVNDPEFLYVGVNDPVFYTMANIAGGTPDLVIPEAIGEVKCPASTTHLQHLLATPETFKVTFPDKYTQMQANMLFCGKDKCYFISYDPRYKDKNLQMKIILIDADPDYQTLIVKKVSKAKVMLDGIICRVIALNK